MNSWKLILPLIVSGSLIACTSTQTTTPPVGQETPEVEQPVEMEPEVKPEAEPTPQVQPQPAPETAEKPKPEKPVKIRKTPEGMLILGSIEWIYVSEIDQTFKATVDTSATTSLIGATEIVPFERDGDDWVQFKIEIDGKMSKAIQLPIERWTKAKQSSSDDVDRRAVVAAYIQIGDYQEKTEFIVTELGQMKFPVRLGRNFFRDIAVVEISEKYIQGMPK